MAGLGKFVSYQILNLMRRRNLYQIKKVNHFYEERNKKSYQNKIKEWSVNLKQLSNVSTQETLVSDDLPKVFEEFFVTTLSKEPELRWLGRGLGVGQELKRGYSALLGRFFARNYLISDEEVRCIVPIDKTNLQFMNKFSIHLTRNSISSETEPPNFPDWIGYTDNEIVIAEAKGSHENISWKNKFNKGNYPSCLNDAIKQVESVSLKILGKDLVPFTGWSIASRWATQDNFKRCPWIATIKSELFKLYSINNIEFDFFKGVISAINLQGLVVALGHLNRQEFEGVISDGGQFLDFKPQYLTIKLADGNEYTGIFSAISIEGIEKIFDRNQIYELSQREYNIGDIELVMIAKPYIEMMKPVVESLYNFSQTNGSQIGGNNFTDQFSDYFKLELTDHIVMINGVAIVKLNSIEFIDNSVIE